MANHRDIEYRILIVPERHVLYKDKLPAGVTLHENRPALQLIKATDALLRPAVIYPAETIRRGRAVREVYYKSDVHWTTWGAYLLKRLLAGCVCTAFQRHSGTFMWGAR